MNPILTIAGSDSSGGAGIQADLKTITMLGGYGMSAITAITAQNTQGVQQIYPVPAEILGKQIESVCSDIAPAAVKIGMVYDVTQIAILVACLQKFRPVHLIIDPVMIATSGDMLQTTEATEMAQHDLFPMAEMITPNLPEASVMMGKSIMTRKEMEIAAKQLAERYETAIYLKGGHRVSDCDDYFYCGTQGTWLCGKRIDTKNTHGTGCTLSAALATYAASEISLLDCARLSKRYVTQALQAGLDLGAGNGPICHNFALQS